MPGRSFRFGPLHDLAAALANALTAPDDRFRGGELGQGTMVRLCRTGLMAVALIAASAAHGRPRYDVIDMHFHADLPDAEGPPGGTIDPADNIVRLRPRP